MTTLIPLAVYMYLVDFFYVRVDLMMSCGYGRVARLSFGDTSAASATSSNHSITTPHQQSRISILGKTTPEEVDYLQLPMLCIQRLETCFVMVSKHPRTSDLAGL